MPEENSNLALLKMTADIAAGFLAKNTLAMTELPGVIVAIHEALKAVDTDPVQLQDLPEAPIPAVPVRKSVTPDFLISLENGKQYKSLKRHLWAQYKMTPHDYRAKWGLPKDYHMVAPNYSAHRSALAKNMGLWSYADDAKAGAKRAPRA